MSKHRKANRRKRRRDERDKIKKSPAVIIETENPDAVDYVELEEEILDLLRAPGATALFFGKNGTLEAKLKIKT